jgi:hypothetical protein
MRFTTRKAGMVLWGVQVVLALLFLLAGGMKLVLPIEVMAAQAAQSGQTPLPGVFLRFIGVAEVLGARVLRPAA